VGKDVAPKGGEFPIAAVAGASAAALLLLILAILLCVFRKRVLRRWRRKAGTDGIKEGLEGLESAEPECPTTREKRRAQKRQLYDRLRAASRKKRQASFIMLHPSQLTPEIVTTHSGHIRDGTPEKVTEGVKVAEEAAEKEPQSRSGRASEGTTPRNPASGPVSAELVGAGTQSSSESGLGFFVAPPVAAAQDKAGIKESPLKEVKTEQSGKGGKAQDVEKSPPQLTPQQQMLMQSMGAGSSGMAGMMGGGVIGGGNSLLGGHSMLYSMMGGSMFGASLFPSMMSTMGADGSIIVPRPAKDKLSKALEAMATAYPPALFADKYVLSNDRIPGRQALIAFAADSTAFQYAIKCAPERLD
jgi:hypothetical protein